MKYAEMVQMHQKEVNEFPMFFAFSNEQFEEGRKKLGVKKAEIKKKIFGIGAGCYMRKDDFPLWRNLVLRHLAEKKDAIENPNTGIDFACDMFVTEMYNHEYAFTYDQEEVLDACGISQIQFENNEILKTAWNKAEKIVFAEE